MATEPIVTFMATYAAFVYGLMFLLLEVYPIVFAEHRGFDPIITALPYLGLLVGTICAAGINLAFQPMYRRAVRNNKGRAAPEARSPPMVVGGILFTTGLFWLEWTADPRHSWVLPVVAGGMLLLSLTCIFLADISNKGR